MNWNRIEGNRKKYAGAAKERWGKPADDGRTAISEERGQLEGKLQERYGFVKEEAHNELDEFDKQFER